MLRIDLGEARPAFAPGDEVRGSVKWARAFPPELIELKLIWTTSGRGSEDVEVVETIAFENPELEGMRSFRLRLPDSPYSFSGKLVSLTWMLELVVRPEDAAERLTIIIAPNNKEITLQ